MTNKHILSFLLGAALASGWWATLTVAKHLPDGELTWPIMLVPTIILLAVWVIRTCLD